MSETKSPPAIEVRGVTKRFGAVTALDNVSFTVEAGRMFFLLGPSGCGKTTMLRILAGLETPDSGTVLFGGEDVADRPPHLRGAPMVFQNYALWPHLDVRDNVAFGLVERKTPRREIGTRVDEVLRKVGLATLGDRMPGQLSGGQQQRVVLARALVLNPSVVLLDEPLSNLDAKLRHEMRDEIEKLHRETDITFIYVTHDQIEALSLADRMAVMRDGRLSAVGTALDLYHRPPNRFCAEFLGEANLFDGVVKGVDARGLCTVETRHGTWTAVRAGDRPPAPGQRAVCLVRPENLRPGADAAGVNVLKATVKAYRITGNTVSVSLDDGGTPLKATLLNRYTLDLKAGQAMTWHAAADDTVLVAEEG